MIQQALIHLAETYPGDDASTLKKAKWFVTNLDIMVVLAIQLPILWGLASIASRLRANNDEGGST